MNSTVTRLAALSLLAFAAATAQAGAIHDGKHQKDQKHSFDRRFETKRSGEFGPYSQGHYVIHSVKFREQARGRHSSSKKHDDSGRQSKHTTRDRDCEPDTSTAVPEPASLALIGAGLMGIAMVRRRRKGAA